MAYRLGTSVAVVDCEVTEIRLLMERHAGVLLDKSSESLGDLIASAVESHHLSSAAELIGLLQKSPAECDALLEQLLPGDTGFMRFPAAFDALGRAVLPEIFARKQAHGGGILRMWSAGCSTGEEAYSMAMTVCEAQLGGRQGCNIHIVGTDIRRSALEAAERGLYPQGLLANIPKHLVGAYFSRVGDHFLVKNRLRNLVTFAPMNLANPSYIGRFDCIVCMDVLPHFSASQRSALIQRLHMYLEPGGFLLLGDNEKMPAAEVTFNAQPHLGYTCYQRAFAAVAKAGR